MNRKLKRNICLNYLEETSLRS